MTQEVIRRHYLEAMGITAWASRYQLPNALPTEACEWEESKPDATPPRERLQALLDDAPAPRRKEAEPPSGEVIASPSAVRALLVNEKQGADKQDGGKTSQATLANDPPDISQATEAKPSKPLTFSLSCLCIDGRWLIMQAGEMSSLEQQLLANLLQAAGIQQERVSEVARFTWPPMVNAFAVEDPLEEAREGVAAFIAGSMSRQGWQLEQLLWWGELGAEQAPLDRILNVSEAYSQTLLLPVWQGPALASLLKGVSSKRNLWPSLQALGQQWAANGAADAR
ncbi:MAG: hypothetical protein EA345_17910 [Halomonas sp.]|nr:hypothetical protein [Halomonas sp.]TVP42790.1 MAG: hypothetical protein EA345_17910 [Halomonas sp.]